MSQKFTANPKRLPELFVGTDNAYRIPIYQREYSWEEEQIERLFEDVGLGIDRQFQGLGSVMFLGTLIDVEAPQPLIPGNPDRVLDVIDGQQRITTVLISAVILRNLIEKFLDGDSTSGRFNTWLVSSLNDQCAKLSDMIELKTGNPQGDSLLQFKPRCIREDEDSWGSTSQSARNESLVARVIWHSIESFYGDVEFDLSSVTERFEKTQVLAIEESIRGLVGPESISETLKLMSVRKHCASYLASINSPEGANLPRRMNDELIYGLRLFALIKFLLDTVQIIEVRAPDEDYAFELFEPLNSAGLALSPIETLKPFVVKASGGFAGSKMKDDFESLEDFIVDDRRKRSRWIRELLIFFSLAESGKRKGSSISEQRRFLKDSFLRSASDSHANAQRYVNDLSQAADFQRNVWESGVDPSLHSLDELTKLCLRVLHDSSHTISRSLVFRYWVGWRRSECSKADFASVVKSTCALWILWRTFNAGTAGIDDFHRDLFDKSQSKASLASLCLEVSSGKLPTALSLRQGFQARIAEMIQDEDAWVVQSSTTNAYKGASVSRMLLLLAYQNSVSDQQNPGLIKKGLKNSLDVLNLASWTPTLTLEHIAPQERVVGESGFDPEIWSQNRLHCLGNLTLLPKEINSSMGARPWHEKRLILEVLQMGDPAKRLELIKSSAVRLKPSTLAFIKSSPKLDFGEELTLVGDEWGLDLLMARGECLARRAWKNLEKML